MTLQIVWACIMGLAALGMGWTLGHLLRQARAVPAVWVITFSMLAVLVFAVAGFVGSFSTPPACQAEDGGPTLPCVWTGTTPDENGLYVKIYYDREPW